MIGRGGQTEPSRFFVLGNVNECRELHLGELLLPTTSILGQIPCIPWVASGVAKRQWQSPLPSSRTRVPARLLPLVPVGTNSQS